MALEKMAATILASSSLLRSSDTICSASASHSFLLKLKMITCRPQPKDTRELHASMFRVPSGTTGHLGHIIKINQTMIWTIRR